jgi:hypothetical protein
MQDAPTTKALLSANAMLGILEMDSFVLVSVRINFIYFFLSSGKKLTIISLRHQ